MSMLSGLRSADFAWVMMKLRPILYFIYRPYADGTYEWETITLRILTNPCLLVLGGGSGCPTTNQDDTQAVSTLIVLFDGLNIYRYIKTVYLCAINLMILINGGSSRFRATNH